MYKPPPAHIRYSRRVYLNVGGRAMRVEIMVVRVLVAASAALCVGAQAASQAPVGAEHGMVVTAHHIATRVGVDVLKRGGNAVDAAVAVGYALAAGYPAAGNLCGGGVLA